jgi:hypothetical protein
MKSTLVLAGLLLIGKTSGQDFALLRSRIKAGGGSSEASTLTVTGNILAEASNQRMTAGTFAVEGNFIALKFMAPAPVVTSITFARSGNNLQLAWPIAATGYLLETTTNLKTASVWTIQNPPRTSSSGFNSVTFPITSPPQIFRLRHASAPP